MFFRTRNVDSSVHALDRHRVFSNTNLIINSTNGDSVGKLLSMTLEKALCFSPPRVEILLLSKVELPIPKQNFIA